MSRSRSRTALAALSFLSLLLVLGTACAPMWRQLRESERRSAVASARVYAKRGDCPAMLAALDHAEAGLGIGAYALEATRMRVVCYERLERHAVARAHRRLLDDFYDTKNPAYPTGSGNDVFRVSRLPDDEFEKPPSALKMFQPHYSERARRSRIVGRVVISFQLTSDDKAKAIRVLEMPHPLLATWAIEAIARTERNDPERSRAIQPGGRYITTFLFKNRFAKTGRQLESEDAELH